MVFGISALACGDPDLDSEDLAGLNLTQAMQATYDSIASRYGLVCGYETGGPGSAGHYGLSSGTTIPPEASRTVRGWSGSIWTGQFEDYELRNVDQRRILLVSADPVPPPHDGYYEPIASGLTLVLRHNGWDVGRVAHLFDCSGASEAPLPTWQNEIATREFANRQEPALRYESFVESVEDDDPEAADQRYAILEVSDPDDWPPEVDLPELAELLTMTARTRWATEFACVIVTRRSVESGNPGTGLTADSPLPDGVLTIFEELRYDPDQASLRRIGTRNIVLAWVESHGDHVWVSGVEFVKTGAGDWSERTWVHMYGCDVFGR